MMRAMFAWLLACTSSTVTIGPPDPQVADSGGGTEDVGGTTFADSGCDPGAEPVYGLEGEPLSFTIGCTGEGTADAFAVASVPDGAAFDASTATFSWTPGLDQAGHYELAVTSAGEVDDRGTVDVWVADAWADPANEPVDPETYEEEYGLPVFHLDVPGTTNDSADVATALTYRGREWSIGLKYRGAASSGYPKRSFTVTFPADDEFRDEDEGFAKRHKIVLTTTFDDNAYVRQALCYELWNALEPSRQQIQTYLAVVYINGEYEGLYLVSDHIDGEWWEDWGYDEDGSLYKSVTHQGNFYADYGGARKTSWHDGYEKQEGVPDDWSDLDAFVQFAAESDDATFSAEIDDRFPVDEIADWWILVRWTESDDSGGKNAYLYVDPATGVIHHAPWDFNHSFGQTWQTDREAASTNYDFFWANNLFARLLADPDWSPVLLARMRAAMDGPFDPAAIVARIEAHVARIEPSAERDWEKWEPQYRSYTGWSWRTNWTSHDEETAYLEQWVQERAGYMETWYP